MPEGERYKSFRMLEKAVTFLSENRFERNDLVVALGGGVVGDLAGFSCRDLLARSAARPGADNASLSDRFFSRWQDRNQSSGWQKSRRRFSSAVMRCSSTRKRLTSLPQRELVSGFCEMVKQSLVADKTLFDMTVDCLQKTGSKRDFLLTSEFENLIAAHCGFKASIVANDERESTSTI